MQIYTKCPYATFENIQIQIIAAFTIIARENFIGILETLISHKQTSDVNRFFDLKSSNGEKSSIVSQSTIKKERWESYSLLPISPHQDVCPNNTKYVDTGYHYHEASVKDIAAVMPSPSNLHSAASIRNNTSTVTTICSSPAPATSPGMGETAFCDTR